MSFRVLFLTMLVFLFGCTEGTVEESGAVDEFQVVLVVYTKETATKPVTTVLHCKDGKTRTLPGRVNVKSGTDGWARMVNGTVQAIWLDEFGEEL